ncbi:helicase associated domain-containing protein [Embleya sp. NPDC001921]
MQHPSPHHHPHTNQPPPRLSGVVEVRLGKWVNNQRTRRSSLSEERVGLLTGLGMRW